MSLIIINMDNNTYTQLEHNYAAKLIPSKPSNDSKPDPRFLWQDFSKYTSKFIFVLKWEKGNKSVWWADYNLCGGDMKRRLFFKLHLQQQEEKLWDVMILLRWWDGSWFTVNLPHIPVKSAWVLHLKINFYKRSESVAIL